MKRRGFPLAVPTCPYCGARLLTAEDQHYHDACPGDQGREDAGESAEAPSRGGDR